MISIDNLKHFVAVVENKGVNRAAEKIAISPSSLTRSIKGIEDQIGQKIFDRVGRKVLLNPRGQDFYSRAKALIGDFNAIVAVPGKGCRLDGHYQIGASHFLAKSLLAEKMGDLARQHPHASFDVFSLDTSLLVKKLHRGDLDVGIGISPRLPATVGSSTLFTGTLYLCAHKAHSVTGLPFSKVKKALSEIPAIMHRATESVERCDNHPMFKAHGIKPRIHLYWDSDEVAVEMLRSGEYWTLLPDRVIERCPELAKLAHPKDWIAPFQVCLLWNKQRSSRELVTLLGSTL